MTAFVSRFLVFAFIFLLSPFALATGSVERFIPEVPATLSSAQYEYVAKNYPLTTFAGKTVIEKLRTWNTSFRALYGFTPYGTSEISQIFEGDELRFFWNDIANNRDWFLKTPASTHYDFRVQDTRKALYIMDLDQEGWRGFVVGALKKPLEDLYDGVYFNFAVDYDAISPTVWTPDGTLPTLYFPRAYQSFARYVQEQFLGKPVYVTVGALRSLDDKVLTFEGIDGVHVTDFARTVSGTFAQGDAWLVQMENVYALVRSGKKVMLTTPWKRLVPMDRLQIMVSYFLVRGKTNTPFFYAYDTVNTTQAPESYPEFFLDLGAPVKEEEKVLHYREGSSRVYARAYEKGLVLLNTDIIQQEYAISGVMKRITPKDGGVVQENGSVTGSWSEVLVSDKILLQAGEGVILVKEGVDYVALPGDAVETETAPLETVVEDTKEEEDTVEETTVSEEEASSDVTTTEETEEEVTSTEALPTFAQIFPDVPTTLKNAPAITLLRERGIIAGYPDGTYQPYRTVNRAELLKILIEGSGITVPEPSRACFSDVLLGEWYTKYVCYAKDKGWVSGYPEANVPEGMWKFQPARTVNKVEALKILAMVQAWEIPESVSDMLFSDTDSTAWYAPFLAYAKMKGFLEEDGTVFGPSFGMNRGKAAEYIFRTLVVRELELDRYTEGSAAPLFEKE